MAKISSGILLYRIAQGDPEVFLVHPGGPFFKNKDLGSWTIPKGLVENENDLKLTALRELREETGIELEAIAGLIPLGSIKQKGGKKVYAWAAESPLFDGFNLRSNSFKLEWPPNSGKLQVFPEIDKQDFFNLKKAKEKIIPEQIPFLERLRVNLETAHVAEGISN